MDDYDGLFIFTLMVGIGMPISALWLTMLSILSKKGISVNYHFISPNDYIKFWRVLKVVDNPKKKRGYKVLFWSQIILLILFFLGGYLIFLFL
jgi:hypothetical protein